MPAKPDAKRQERNLKIVELYKDNLSTSEIGKIFNLEPTYIYQILNKCGCVDRHGRDYGLEERDQELLKAYQSGLTAKEVGEKFGLKRTRIYKILEKNNCLERHCGKPNIQQRNEDIIIAYNGGLSSIQVGKKFGLNKSSIIKILKDNGCDIHPSRLDLIGQRFNRLVVIKPMKNNGVHTTWLCKCDCGNEVIVRTNNLRNGGTNSCGCYKIDKIIEAKTTHGMSCRGNKRPEFKMLHAAKKRAKQKGLPFNLEVTDIIIPEYCPVFPEMKLKHNIGTIGPDSPTLDRLVPEYGYVKENIMVISHKANSIKQTANPDEILQVAIWLEKELKLQKRKHLKVVGVK